jgi:VWFA-related protein
VPLGLLLLFLSCAYLFPESKKAKKEAELRSQPIYRVKTNAVVVKATVTDKEGNPVTDLTLSDFKVFDDEKPQSIQTFARESFGPSELEANEEVTSASPKQTAKEQKAELPRLISIVIDDLTMESAETKGSFYIRPGSILEYPRMVAAVKKFVKTDIGPTDQVSILSGSRMVQLPFSDNKQRLLEELDTVLAKLNRVAPFRETGTDVPGAPDRYGVTNSLVFPEITDLEAWLISNNKIIDLPVAGGSIYELRKMEARTQNAEVEYRTRSLLATIRQHLLTLTHFENPRMVVIFSDGFLTEAGTAEAYRLQELISLALRSGIIINSVSTRSIPGVEPPPPPTVFSIGIPHEMNRASQEQPLAQIASETGGRFFARSNDMYIGLKDIAHRRSSYYILTYGMPSHKADGAYHHIKLEVTRPGLELSYRKGYYTPKEEMTFENSKKEDIIEALNAPGNMNQIPMTLSYSYFKEDDATYAVSFIMDVNIHGLRFAEEEARRKNQISLFLVAYDETDHYISGLEKSIDFQLLEKSYAELLNRGLTSRVELKLPLGRYKIKAVVREGSQGKMGSITKAVEIP